MSLKDALWKFAHQKELRGFLKPSVLCDSDHPVVKVTAIEITTETRTSKEAAVKIFYFVRDKIKLALVHPWKSASETLKIGKGSCLTKATLQVALLRSVGIPARFRVLEFKGNNPEEWEGILPSFAVSRMPEKWPHYFAEVYIDGKWIMADATFDKYLVHDTEHWDGEKDVCSVADTAILSDMGTVTLIEEEAEKLDEKYRVPVVWFINSYKSFWIINIYQEVQRLRNKHKCCKTVH